MEFNPTEDRDPSEVTPLQKARRDFLQYKQQTQKASTARAYKYPTKDFIEYCENVGVSVTGDISKRNITKWIDQRREEVKPVTVHNNAKHLRVFIKWMAHRELVEWGLHEKMEIPDVPEDEDVNQQVLREGHAESVLQYLDTYHYASIYHALFYTMWHTGCRISGAIALDLNDFEPSPHDDSILKFRNRPSEGTPLKNKNKSERDVTISDGLANVLSDYVNSPRESREDDYGREPLFTVPSGRLYRQRAYKNIVALTRPCVSGGKCPLNREIESCEAAQDKEQAPSCPDSVSLHPVRKGSITNHINEGWPKEPLSERVDVSVEVLEKHYDFRTNERKRQNRREFLHE
ncbi:tyrosine-type recombinase/integrase [Halobellus sp. EA9]|uniref:tyrosine-type recombinase/integrase n=1 Tax=Halobellus sp. EA9 TaxID=3421647 RepID=UPI003EB6C167